jgi:anti-sigma-K factor RskA
LELKDIISSGLLELYILGLTSQDESIQVQQWIKQYPEVQKEIDNIQDAMESYALAHAIQPDQSVKKRILDQLSDSSQKNAITVPSGEINENAKVYTISTYFKWAAAACFILLIGSLVVNYTYYNRYKSATSDLQTTRQQLTQQKQTSDLALRQLQEQKQNVDFTQEELQKQKQTANLTQEQLLRQKQTADAVREELERQKQVAEAMNKDISVMTDKNSLPVVLNGTPHAPDALAKIFWMKNTGEVYVDPTHLPQAPAGKQYQLWAIVNDKPVSAGVISTNKGVYHIQKMKSFGKAEAFAITLEKTGGSPTPNMKEMYVMSKI